MATKDRTLEHIEILLNKSGIYGDDTDGGSFSLDRVDEDFHNFLATGKGKELGVDVSYEGDDHDVAYTPEKLQEIKQAVVASEPFQKYIADEAKKFDSMSYSEQRMFASTLMIAGMQDVKLDETGVGTERKLSEASIENIKKAVEDIKDAKAPVPAEQAQGAKPEADTKENTPDRKRGRNVSSGKTNDPKDLPRHKRGVKKAMEAEADEKPVADAARAETAGKAFVDEDSSAAESQHAEDKFSIRYNGHEDSSLSDAYRADLAKIAAFLKENPETRIQIESHAFDKDEADHVVLRRSSLDFAQQARNALLEGGVESYRILVRAHGSVQDEENRSDFKISNNSGDDKIGFELDAAGHIVSIGVVSRQPVAARGVDEQEIFVPDPEDMLGGAKPEQPGGDGEKPAVADKPKEESKADAEKPAAAVKPEETPKVAKPKLTRDEDVATLQGLLAQVDPDYQKAMTYKNRAGEEVFQDGLLGRGTRDAMSAFAVTEGLDKNSDVTTLIDAATKVLNDRSAEAQAQQEAENKQKAELDRLKNENADLKGKVESLTKVHNKAARDVGEHVDVFKEPNIYQSGIDSFKSAKEAGFSDDQLKNGVIFSASEYLLDDDELFVARMNDESKTIEVARVQRDTDLKGLVVHPDLHDSIKSAVRDRMVHADAKVGEPITIALKGAEVSVTPLEKGDDDGFLDRNPIKINSIQGNTLENGEQAVKPDPVLYQPEIPR